MTRTLHRVALAAMVCGTLLVAGALTPAGVAPARAQGADSTQSGSPLQQAQALYDQAKFADAAALLRTAIEQKQVTGNDELKARELLGRSLVKSGNRLAAKEAFKALLHEDSAYRLDTLTVPPDEVEVFDLAVKDITAEQIAAGQRVPASITLFGGVGSGANKDIADFVKDGGGKDKFDSKGEFGGAVRFPLRQRLSLDIELARFRATEADSFRTGFRYEATAIPLIVSLYYTVLPRDKYRLNVFGGLGPMMASRVSFKLPETPPATLTIADEREGFVIQGGFEGEYLFVPRFSVTGRFLGRSATASGFFKGDNLTLYTSKKLDNRKVDFSGIGAFIGLRAYIGY